MLAYFFLADESTAVTTFSAAFHTLSALAFFILVLFHFAATTWTE